MSKKQLKTVIEMQDKFSKELKDFSQQLHNATDDLKKFNSESNNSSSGADKLTGSLLKLSNIVKTVGIAYLGKKILDLGNFSVNAASKMNELENVTAQVFTKSKKEIEDWAKNIDDKIGRSIYQMQNFASVYGSMFKGAGFDESYFKNISKELAVLTADFSSFFNVSDDEAFTALKGALTGETEALKRYGIILNDTVMAQYALTKGIKENWSELDVATKMQLRYNKLMEVTSFVQGDASRTIDGYANSLKKAEGLIDNIATSIGQKLIPHTTKAVHMFNDIATAIDDMLSKKDSTEYIFDFVKEKQSIDELKEKYIDLSKKYLEGLATPETEKERLDLYNKILALYPDLIGKIDSEAAAYDGVAKALDGVIAKLKQKTLAQAQEQFFDEQFKTAQKYSEQIVEIQSKVNNLKLSNLAKHNINADEIFTQEFSKKVRYAKEHEKEKLIREELNKKGLDSSSSAVKDLREYGRIKWNSENEARMTETQMNMKLQELQKNQEQQMKVIEKSLNIITNSNTAIKNSVIEKAGKAAQNKVQETKNKLDTHREENTPKVETENNAELEKLKADAKAGKLKKIDEYRKLYDKLVSIGAAGTPEANEVLAKISELERKAKKSKTSSTKKENVVQWSDYQKDIYNNSKYQEAIGSKEEDKLKARISVIQSYLRKAIEQGREDLVEGLKKDLETTEFSLKRIKINEALDEMQKDLDKLDTDFKNGDLKKEDYHTKSFKILDDIITKYEEHRWELSDLDKKAIEEQINNIKDKRNVHNQEVEAHKDLINKLKRVNTMVDNLNHVANGFSQLASVTGSKTLGGIGSMFGSMASLGSAVKTLQDGKDVVGSLAALKAATGIMGTAGAGLATMGTIATGVGAVIGIGSAIGSVLGRSGKKKAAKIDARNQENENKYNEQVKAMQALTQALVQNSERLKSFADRMLIDVAKNPTLKGIIGGEKNFTTIYDAMIQAKHFNDIDAIKKGSKKYRSGFRKKRKDTFTAIKIGEAELLKYLGFDKTELDLFTDDEMRQLSGAIKNIGHEDLKKATKRNLTQSTIEEWKAQINEFVAQIDYLDKERKELFRGSTLESLTGIEFKAEKELIAEYTERFKQLGLVGEQYSETIKEMAKNNQVLVSTMQDVRASTIEALSNNNGGFTSSMKGYFEKIYKNASSIAYDVAFSDMDSYFNKEFEKISEKLVEIKRTGKLDFSDLFTGFDFEQLKLAEINEIQAKKSLDVLKQQLLNSGIDLSIVNKILPQSDFNDRINDLKSSLSTAMSAGLEEHKFDSFTKSLGQSLYDSTKSSLVKAFSESSLYQSMIQKFVNVEDFKSKLEAAGSFKEAFTLSENLLKKFGYEMEANGFGGFDAINNKADVETQLGNAYYQDKASNVNINVTNNFNREVYGLEDFKNIILDTTEKGIKLFFDKPKVLSI
ncbi:MAG: hypothetical protein SPJ84_06480 [Fusobacterium gastrosuis]|uniref:hypothetical protein n=1 Tax=Fusobacterium gastrosuis TaxID=1755100 RepID=UPI002A9798EA|nr:hypothetical protein [Fusobacterium gastrosuis]